MSHSISLLFKYASLFRKMINRRVQVSDRSIRELLKLNSASDWEFLTAAMDIIDDGSAAIGHVQKFGLCGPTKYDDLGEKYLRLYGVLSATYIQQQSIGAIYRIMNVPHLKELQKKFKALEIRDLRHKLSSHGTDYLDHATRTKQAFVPLRFDLGNMRVTYVNHTSSSSHHQVDISSAIDAHVGLMTDTLDAIIEKSIKTIFKANNKAKDEFFSDLADLRIEKAGGLVLKTSSGPKLVATLVGSEKS